MEIAKETKELCEELLREANTLEDAKDAEEEKEKKDQQDKENQRIADQQDQVIKQREAQSMLDKKEAEENKKKAEEAAQEKAVMEKAMEEQNNQAEKEEINNIREHKTSEKTAPWSTTMTEEHMRLIVRWIRNLKEDDLVFKGVITQYMILDKEEAEHTTVEKYAHQHCHAAMTDAGLAPENMDDKL
eukprot:16437052-Heterocapsa_arctica.AAC.1